MIENLPGPVEALAWKARLALTDTIEAEVADTTARFEVTTPIEYKRAATLMDEDPVISEILSDLRPSDVVFDVGANVGMYSVFLVQQLSSGKLYCFEPYHVNLSQLQMNLRLNHGKDGWMTQPVALSDKSGTGQLAVGGEAAGSGEHILHKESNEETTDIVMWRADELINNGIVEVPDVMKIDVEGAELSVLRGFGDYLSDVRVLFVEEHPSKSGRSGKIREFLRNNGFQVSKIHKRGDEIFYRASTY